MRCGDCKHWKLDSDRYSYWGEDLGFGICTRILLPCDIYDMGQDYGYEMRKKYVSNKIREIGAFVQDASDYRAELYTMPDFFCARFEQK